MRAKGGCIGRRATSVAALAGASGEKRSKMSTSLYPGRVIALPVASALCAVLSCRSSPKSPQSELFRERDGGEARASARGDKEREGEREKKEKEMKTETETEKEKEKEKEKEREGEGREKERSEREGETRGKPPA